NYIGGMIMPGIRVSLDSLVSRTSQLMRISLEAPKRLIGKNTAECMKSGAIHGNAACIDGMIDRIENELGEKATVIATGGLAGTITPHCLHEILLDDALLLKGLMYIYYKNKAD
ncbi:MAG: type III pantothenate kinase, partial [Lachnospiraceae bacterium]|nr:type III pantothenate kinase [Lachnospiraceae bacterium]